MFLFRSKAFQMRTTIMCKPFCGVRGGGGVASRNGCLPLFLSGNDSSVACSALRSRVRVGNSRIKTGDSNKRFTVISPGVTINIIGGELRCHPLL